MVAFTPSTEIAMQRKFAVPEKVVLSWSGGKDSAMALEALLGDERYEVVGLLTTQINNNGYCESRFDFYLSRITELQIWRRYRVGAHRHQCHKCIPDE